MTEGRALRVAQGLAVALVLALLGLLVWKVVQADSGGAAGKLAAGEAVAAPPFVLERLDEDGELSLESLRGKAVVLNFWASWCIPCRDEAPLLQEVWERYRDDGLVVLGVDAQDFKQDARRFLERYELTYPAVYDGKGSTLGRYGVTGFPETFFVDRSGRLVGERISGGIDGEENARRLQEGIELVLASEAPEGSETDEP